MFVHFGAFCNRVSSTNGTVAVLQRPTWMSDTRSNFLLCLVVANGLTVLLGVAAI